MILKIALFDNVISINLIYMIIFIIPITLLFKVLTSLFPPITNKIISYFIAMSMTIIFVAQLVYYKTYLSIFSVYSMGKAEQLVDYIDTILKIIYQNIFFIIFSNRSFITEKGRYNSITDTFENSTDNNASTEYISNISSTIDDRFYLSRKILETDYYRKILGN